MAATKYPPLRSGSWKGVFSTNDPYDASPEYLVDAKNGAVTDPQNKSGWSSRRGFRLLFSGTPLVTAPPTFRGQAVYVHTMLDGSTINFIVMGGKLFRVNDTLTTATDVTPVGVSIDAGITTRVFFVSLIGTLTVTDGVHRPWVATNMTSTPITGTYVDYDGHGVAWTAYGAPVVYGGAVFMILNTVNGISRRADISWSEDGDPTTGWQQDTFDNNWTLSQNEAGLLYALAATNLALYYFRESSIGSVSGTVGPNLASTATDDAIAFNIGSQAAQTIRKFGSGFFFCDAQGRPYYYEPGAPPQPIWKQMRSFVEDSTVLFPTTTAIVATSVIEPTLNLYLVAIWSPTPSTQAPPVQVFVFDAQTRLYQGRWIIAPGIGIECIGTFLDAAGRATLIVLGSLLKAPAVGGYVWAFNGIGSVPDLLTTEDGRVLTTEDGRRLTTEGQEDVWHDNGAVPDIVPMTDRLGYSDDVNWLVDRATIITLSDTPIQVTIQTSANANTVEGIPEPSLSQDGTFRFVVGCDLMGRGPQVSVKPLAADDEWTLESVSLKAIPSATGPEDS